MKNFTLLIIFGLLASISVAQTATFNWESTEMSAGNILQKMSITGNTAVIAGFDNTFLKSTNGGESWDTLNPINPIFNLSDISVKGSVGYIVSSSEKLYDAEPDVYANGVILKTIDGGQTWATIESPILGDGIDSTLSPNASICYGYNFTAVETVNDSVAFCTMRWYEYLTDGKNTHGGVFKTTDGGANWINVSGDLGAAMSSIVFSGNSGYVTGNKKLFKATANSDTLVDIFSKLPGDGTDYIWDIDIVDENEVLLTTTSDSVYFSYDGGNTFDKFPGIKGGMDVLKINDSTIVVSGNSNKSFVSTDNGETWNGLGVGASVWEIAGVINDSLNLLTKSAIYKCSLTNLLTGNYNFIATTVADGNIQKAFIADENTVTIVGNDGIFLKSTDAGLSWTPVEMPENPAMKAFYENLDFNDLSNIGDEAYVCFNRRLFVDHPSSSELEDIFWSGGILYTDDNWETSIALDMAKLGKANPTDPAKNPNHASCNGVNTSTIHYMGNGVVLVWARWFDYSTDQKVEHSMVFKSTNNKDWTPITDDLGNKYIQDIKSAGDTVYIAGKETLLKSVDAGATFINLYPVLDEDEDDAMFINAVKLGAYNELFIVTYADSIRHSTDGGATFKVLGDVKGANDFYKFDQNSYFIMGGSGKSRFTNDGGETWQDGHPGSTIFEIGGVYNNKFYALAKGNIFTNSFNNFELLTSIQGMVTNDEISIRYKTNSIELVSSEKTIEKCSVYSITGKLVSVYEPNERSYELLRSNYNSGIYILDAVIEGKRYAKKIVF